MLIIFKFSGKHREPHGPAGCVLETWV